MPFSRCENSFSVTVDPVVEETRLDRFLHYENVAFIAAPAERVFEYVDDHNRLSSHMSRSSWMMGGGSMQIELDAGLGKGVGSRIRLTGRAFGVRLNVEEIVRERKPL